MTDNIYWAAKPIDSIAAEIESKFAMYKKWGQTTGYFERINAAYRAFYTMDAKGTLRVDKSSDDVAQISVNHYRSLIKRSHQLVCENKLAFQPRSKNSDSKSQVEADLARGICEYYGESKEMHSVLSRSVLGALIQLENYIYCPWSVTEGYAISVDGEATIKSGDQKFVNLGPMDVAKATATETSPWYIVREKVSKWDEAAMFPAFRDEILSSGIETDIYDWGRSNRLNSAEDDGDCCYKYTLLHGRTPAMERGREVVIIAGQVLSDQPLRYDTVPLFRITAGEVMGTPFGDSPAIDLLPLQQALDSIISGVVTNNLNNSVQLIYSADPNLTTKRMSDGQTLVTAASRPEGLNLTSSSGESYKMIDLLTSHQQLLSGVNDVARGNPGASVKTSGGQALMIAQAIQYVSELQKNYARVAGDVGSCLISNIQKFATETMTAYIVGSSRKGEIKTFKSSDLLNVERVSVDLGNPLSQSFAGRSELISAWQQYGIIKDPKQIVSFLRTGEIDQITENPFSDALRVREVCEMIRKGQKPQALITDNHAEIIVGIKAIMSSEEARQNPAVVAAYTVCTDEHIALMRQMPPDLAAILAGQPLPPLAPINVPAPQQPQVGGQGLPKVPAGTPPQVAANYQQSVSGVPDPTEPVI